MYFNTIFKKFYLFWFFQGLPFDILGVILGKNKFKRLANRLLKCDDSKFQSIELLNLRVFRSKLAKISLRIYCDSIVNPLKFY